MIIWEEWAIAKMRVKGLVCEHEKSQKCLPMRSHGECLDCFKKDTNGTDNNSQ